MNNRIKPVRYKHVAPKRAEKIVVRNEPLIKVVFPYNPEDVNFIRNIHRRVWMPVEKYWTIPYHVDNIAKLSSRGFSLSDELKEDAKTIINTPIKHLMQPTKIEIPGLKGGTLKQYQEEGVWYAEYWNGRILIADEMGLGKTVEALAWLQLHPEARPAIVVTTASAKLNWAREANKWMTRPKVQVLTGTNTSIALIGEIFIINYDIVDYWKDTLYEIEPKCLVLDECHSIKNERAKRTKALFHISKGIPYVLSLSGTPILNRPVEIYNSIKITNPTLFPNRWAFLQRYCGAKRGPFGWDFNGASNIEELHEILTKNVMIRRLKKDVLKELPDKMYSFIPVEIENRKEYDRAEEDIVEYIRERKGDAKADRAAGAETLVMVEELKSLAVKGAFHLAVEYIKDFLEQSDKKLVVFGIHQFVIESLISIFPDKCAYIYGGTPQPLRQQMVDDFQTNPNIRLFFGNIKAAGVAITLTAASDILFLEIPWTPGELAQAIDRVHRISQVNAVHVRFLFGTNTIMERIANVIDEKLNVLSNVLDGKDVEETTLLTNIMKQYETT